MAESVIPVPEQKKFLAKSRAFFNARKEWVLKRAEWINKLSPSQRLLLSAALLAGSLGGAAIGGVGGGFVLLGTFGIRAIVGVAAGVRTHEMVTKYFENNGMSSVAARRYGAAASFVVAVLFARSMGILLDKAGYAFEHGLIAPAYGADSTLSIVDTGDRFPTLKADYISGLENLSSSSFEAKAAHLASVEQRTKNFLEMYRRVVPSYDQNLLKLEQIHSYYQSVHEQFLSHSDKFTRVDAFRALYEQNPENKFIEYRFRQSEWMLRGELAQLGFKAPSLDDSMKVAAKGFAVGTGSASGIDMLSLADESRVAEQYNAILDSYNQAKPGTVWYRDPNTLKYSWKPLNELIPYKPSAVNQLPLSTARVIYRFWTELDNMRSAIDLDNNGSKALQSFLLTEGWQNTAYHVSEGHRIGTAIDFALRGGYDAKKIALVLATGEKIPGCDIFYESPNASQISTMQEQVYAALREMKMDDATARSLAEKHVRYIAHATGDHFHMETPKPPVYAPTQMVATK